MADMTAAIRDLIETQGAGLLLRRSYHFARTPTIDTGIAMAVQTTFADTSAVLTIANSAAVQSPGPGGPYLVPDFIRLIVTAAGATTTSSEWAVSLDATPNRFSSGGSVLTQIRPNTDDLGTTGTNLGDQATIRAGALVLSAAGGNRQIIGHGIIKAQAAPSWVVGDEVFFSFRNHAQVGGGDVSIAGAVAGKIGISVPPVALGPQSFFALHLWNILNSGTPPSFEFEVGYFVKENLSR